MPLTRERAHADVILATEQVIPFFRAHGLVLRGWALVEQEHHEEGMIQLRQGLADYRATGAEQERSHWLGLLAEACVRTGQSDEGLSVVGEALADIERLGIRYYEAELHRLKGELLLAQSHENWRDAEACFSQAIDVARRQQAKSLELRATTSWSRLLERLGKRDDARRMLAEIHGWFTEGFDTADLQDAKVFLDQLS